MKGFDWKSITLKKSVNVFERMDIAEYIYKSVLEYYYKKLLGKMPTVMYIVLKSTVV